MPDDTFEIPDVPNAEQDLMAPTEERFYECTECALKPGSPVLCADCLERRSEHGSTGRTRRPIYRSLSNDVDRRRYLRYLAWARDRRKVPYDDLSIYSEEELDREFPDRREERLPGYRFGDRPEEVVRNSWGMPSIWGQMQVSRMFPSGGVTIDTETETIGPPVDSVLANVEPAGPDFVENASGQLALITDPPFNLASEHEHIARQIEAGVGLQRGQLISLAGRQTGRSWITAQMALDAVQRGVDVRMIRPQGEPINVNAEVTTAAESGQQLSATDLLNRIREISRSLGIDTQRPDPGVLLPTMMEPNFDVGMDYAAGRDRTAMATANFGRVYGTTERNYESVLREISQQTLEEMRHRWSNQRPKEVSSEVALTVATLLDADFIGLNPYEVASELEDWPLLAVQQVLHNVGISPGDAGLAGIPKVDRQKAKQTQATWWVLAEEFCRALNPRSTRAGYSTGPTRFERDVTIPETVEPIVWLAPRPEPPKVAASALSYVNHRHRSSAKAAFEKLFGSSEQGAFDLPSRYERINWADE